MDLTDYLEQLRRKTERETLNGQQERQAALLKLNEIQILLAEMKALQSEQVESLVRLNKTLSRIATDL